MLVAGKYKQWVDMVKQVISRYSKAEQDQILHKNAVAAYKL
jgi:predicted TIM-barrel fold metal-dependent hydrolase